MISQYEKKRVAKVKRFLNLEISKEKQLNDIVSLAAQICQTPIALITLIDDKTQYFKFRKGIEAESAARKLSFCNETIKHFELLVIPDTTKDHRFYDHPFVTGEPSFRFYAGSPLTTQDGLNIGSICVLDLSPKELTESQKQLLGILGNEVLTIIEFEMSLAVLKEQYAESKRMQDKIRSFFESSISCHLLIDKELKAVYYNKSMAAFIKKLHNTEIKVGSNVTAFIPGPFVPDFINNFRTALGGLQVKSERQVHFEKEVNWWYLTYEPAYNDEGEIIGISFNAIDTTQKAEQERKIAEQNKSLREIARIQSHELRSPVASIMGLMEVWKAENYNYNAEIINMMENAVHDLDQKIHLVIKNTPL